MQNPNRAYDKTHLSIDQAEERGFVHRDYIAHCHRWSHVVKHLMQRHQYKDAHILDIGCGKDQPLPRLMYSNKMTGFSYTGIDMNRMDFHPVLAKAHVNGKVRAALMEETDASLVEPDDLDWGLADFLVCFEVLEHMQPWIVHRMLHTWKKLCKPDALLFISTPVFNGSAAANHINEMSRDALEYAFWKAGFNQIGNYGTFASQSDMYHHMEYEHKQVFNRLRSYYDSNLLSTIFAPLYPAYSRNNLWVLKNRPTDFQPAIPLNPEQRNQNPNISQAWEGRPDEKS